MKKQIPTPVAVAIVATAFIVLVGYGWWVSGRSLNLMRDVRPLVKEMHAGKPKTNLLPPDTDVVMMGGGPKKPPKK